VAVEKTIKKRARYSQASHVVFLSLPTGRLKRRKFLNRSAWLERLIKEYTMIIEKLLKKITEMTSLSDDSVNLLLTCAQQKEFAKGQCLLNERQICNYLYFVENGWLRTYINQEGKEIIINFTFEGSFTGNIKSLKTKQPSQCIIEAGERSLVTLFDKEDLLKLYSEFSEIEFLCRKILGFYKLHSHAERYEYLVKNKPEMIRRIPVSQLSSYIGVARETLSRIRKKMI
jgi:CRP-like cAMP-binding protein